MVILSFCASPLILSFSILIILVVTPELFSAENTGVVDTPNKRMAISKLQEFFFLLPS